MRSIVVRRARRLAAVTATAVCALTAPSAGQEAGTIQGTVLEEGTQRPLSGVQVSVPASGRGALTNAAGEFQIVGLPAGPHTVRAQFIGYTTAEQEVTIPAGEVAQADFTLSRNAIALDEIVVTGTPGATQKREIGNAITTLDAEELTSKTTITSVADLLQSKTPGLTLLPNSGTPGSAPDIRIRGASSLIGNAPVIYIDGVRVNNESLGNFTPSGAAITSFSGLGTSAFDLINPEDIESIEVIKGPAASTLYGADAANGVIQIITKSGARGNQSLRWDARYERGWNEWDLTIPDNRTTCNTARIAEVDAVGNAVWPGCQGVTPGTILVDNPMRRDPLALREGTVQTVGLSVRGGGDRYSFYIGAEADQNEGVFYNSYNDKKSIRANFAFNPIDILDFQVNTSYLQGDLRLPLGGESAEALFLSAARGQPGHVPPAGNPEAAGWWSTNAEQANEYNNTTDSDRLTLGTTVNFTPISWFRNRLTLGLDYTSSLAQVIAAPGSVDASYGGVPEGIVGMRRPQAYNYTVDYAGSLLFDLSPALRSTTSFGVQSIQERFETLSATGSGFGAPGVTLIGTAQTTSGDNTFSESKTLGFYVQEQLGWQNRLFVTGAVRVDNSSVFGTDIEQIYYPKASLSWVLSEEPALADWFQGARIENFRVRTAWGQAGNAPDPFAAARTYTVDIVAMDQDSVASALRANSIGNPDLEPERGSEFEIGFDAGLFEGRAGVEFTYYNKRMSDVIISAPTPGSSGFGGAFFGFTDSQLLNLGETLNRGIELGLTATPVQTPQFIWDSRVSFSTNDNELVSFGDDRESIVVPGASYGAVQQHREGYPLAGYWAAVPLRNDDGTPVVQDGVVQFSDDVQFIGPSAPTRELGFANTFTIFNDFRVFALLDYKSGHYLYNYREYDRCRNRGNCERVNDPANVDPVTGEVLNPEVYIWTQAIADWMEPADFVKLRDLSLTYSVPTRFAQRFGASQASITLAGHNLAIWSDYSGMDPEVNNYGNRDFVRADIYAAPQMRRVTMSINLGF